MILNTLYAVALLSGNQLPIGDVDQSLWINFQIVMWTYLNVCKLKKIFK